MGNTNAMGNADGGFFHGGDDFGGGNMGGAGVNAATATGDMMDLEDQQHMMQQQRMERCVLRQQQQLFWKWRRRIPLLFSILTLQNTQSALGMYGWSRSFASYMCIGSHQSKECPGYSPHSSWTFSIVSRHCNFPLPRVKRRSYAFIVTSYPVSNSVSEWIRGVF